MGEKQSKYISGFTAVSKVHKMGVGGSFVYFCLSFIYWIKDFLFGRKNSSTDWVRLIKSVQGWKWHTKRQCDKPATFHHYDQLRLLKDTSRYGWGMMGPCGKEEGTWSMQSGKYKEQLMRWWNGVRIRGVDSQ